MEVITPVNQLIQYLFRATKTSINNNIYLNEPVSPMDSFFTVRSNEWLYLLGIYVVLFYVLKRIATPTWDILFFIIAGLIFYAVYANKSVTDTNYLNDIIHRINFLGNMMYGPKEVHNIRSMSDYENRLFYNENELNYFYNFPRIIVFLYNCRFYYPVHTVGYRSTLLELNEFCKIAFLLENKPEHYTDKGEALQKMYQHMHDALNHFYSIQLGLEPLPDIMEKHTKELTYLQEITWSQYTISRELVIKREDYQDPNIFTYWENNNDSMAMLNDLSKVDTLHFGVYSK
jgi:hypothetical protein